MLAVGRTSASRFGPPLTAIAGVLVLLSACSDATSQAEVAQAKEVATEAQAQKDSIRQQQDIQASLSAQVKQLKEDAAKAATTEAAEAKASEAEAAAAKGAAKASRAYNRHHNGRFGFSCDVPVNFRSHGEPANGDGFGYNSPDGRAEISCAGEKQPGFCGKPGTGEHKRSHRL